MVMPPVERDPAFRHDLFRKMKSITGMKMEAYGNTLRVWGHNELTATNVDQFKSQVLAATSDRVRFIECDMSELKFIDSRGVGTLISLNRACQSNDGRLRLIAPSPVMEQVIRIARLDRAFEVLREPQPAAGKAG